MHTNVKMIKKRYLVPFEERLFCDNCGSEMQFSGKILMTQPEKYEYLCPKCNKVFVSEEKYPNIKYEEKTVCSDVFQRNWFKGF